MTGKEDAPSRTTRKRLLTRQKISDTATRLFFEHGFDKVTVDEIAEAADVSRMTVFNHFARKEDMFFDLDEEARDALLQALHCRDKGLSPVHALRLFLYRAVAEDRPYAVFFKPETLQFMATIQASEALKARARAIRDEYAEVLAMGLARSVNRSRPDAVTHLAASLALATCTVALTTAHAAFREHGDAARAKRRFFKIVDQGMRGVEAALEGTPYVQVPQGD